MRRQYGPLVLLGLSSNLTVQDHGVQLSIQRDISSELSLMLDGGSMLLILLAMTEVSNAIDAKIYTANLLPDSALVAALITTEPRTVVVVASLGSQVGFHVALVVSGVFTSGTQSTLVVGHIWVCVSGVDVLKVWIWSWKR